MEARIIRPPAVAGMFYPGEPQTLASEVAAMLGDAASVSRGEPADAAPPAPSLSQPKALIVPHAGYIYSGPIAASAYALLAPFARAIRRVVLLGPCHRIAVRGLAVPHAQAFATPLGAIPLDRDAIAAVAQLPQVIYHDAAHAQEHSLEVQLPFLQAVLESFTLVPLAVGYATPDEVAQVLDWLWGGPETLIVISSDLSHYHSYLDAQRRDRHTVEAISHLQLLVDHEQACGATPINGLIEVAQRRGLTPQLLDLRNSGDTAGDRARVVGYASFAFSEDRHD